MNRTEYSKQYYLTNREAILSKTSQYNRDNREKRSAYHAKWRQEKGPEYRLWKQAKDRAKRQGLEFQIDISDVVIPEVCPILLTPFTLMAQKWSATSPSLDRVDTSKGYVKGNIAVISARANACKSNLTQEEIGRLFTYSQNT